MTNVTPAQRPRAALAAATTGFLMGGAMVATRAVSSEAAPVTIAFLRYLFGIVFLLLPIIFTISFSFKIRDFFSISFLGVFQFAITMILINYSLSEISATTCSIIFSTMPMFTMILCIICGTEKLTLVKAVGLILTLTGVFIVLQGSAPDTSVRNNGSMGLIAVIGATLVGAVCSILYRPYLRRYAVLPTSALSMGAAVLFLAALCIISSEPLFPPLLLAGWGNILFIGLASGLGFFLWLWAMARLGSSRVVSFQTLAPVAAAAIEAVVTLQLPTWELLLAIALVVSGLLLSLREKSLPLSA